MLFCPPRLLPSSLRARSPCCSAGQRFRTALHYQRRTLVAGSTLFSKDVVKPDTPATENNSAGIWNFADPEGPVTNDPSTADDFVSRAFAEDNHQEASVVIAKPGDCRVIPSIQPSINPVRSDILLTSPTAVSGVPRRIIERFHYDVDGNKHVREQILDDEVRQWDMEIRARSLFSDGYKIKKWRQWFASIREAKETGGALPTIPTLRVSDRHLITALGADSKESFRDAWDGLDDGDKGDCWHRLSLWLACHSPNSLPEFLQTTCRHSSRKPIFVAVAACVQYLLSCFPALVGPSLVLECLHPDNWPVALLPQRPARLYIMYAGRDDVLYAWNLARERRIGMNPNTILGFMKRFTYFREVDAALEAIQMVKEAAHPQFPMESDEVVRHCCKLLTIDYIVDDGGGRKFRAFSKLLELGVPLTRDLMNVVLSNALKSDEPNVAQVILNHMKYEGIEPDAYTFMALLTNAVRVGNDELFQSMFQEYQVKKELQRNPWILSKILHAHFLYVAKGENLGEGSRTIFHSMLDMYGRLHDVSPLKDLLILPQTYVQKVDNVTPPSAVALFIMIATYLRYQTNMAKVEDIYSRFRDRVLGGHESIAPLAATEHTYNEFLVAFRASPAGFRPAVRVVEDMQHSSSSPIIIKAHGSGENRQVEHTPATVRTWTLLMSCFVFNKQPHAAEKVRVMMDQHGIQYNIDAWNMIISNHANSQNVPALAGAFKQMEREGIHPDSYTLNPLRYLRDPERLWVAIDELDRLESQQGVPEFGRDDNYGTLLEEGLQRLKDKPRGKT
ncbi:hypothetical protein BDW74DRAFT_151926 [Aspergillus multicolor]|uniref:pentatricopeptide repeat protein n=1 Tax=Aspergillus multicolor TaxID=41759 RepID=UPI003CCDE195